MAIENFRKWLQSKYTTELGISIEESHGRTSSVTWLQQANDAQFASFFDADIGVWTRVTVLANPATTSDRTKNEVQAALSDLSTLGMQANVPDQERDPNGPWTIRLLFLVNNICEAEWRTAVEMLRSESGFSEELGIDVVFYEQPETLGDDLDSIGGLPFLLLETRQLFSLDVTEVPTWLSADAKIRQMLKSFPDQFDDVAVQLLAKELVAKSTSEEGKIRPIELPSVPSSVGVLAVNQFRNIQTLRLQLSPGPEKVTSQIVFGPNGTGKSSIFEALSLAICGSSKGLEDFLRDTDNRANSQQYLEEVIRPFSEEAEATKSSSPSVQIDESEYLTNLAKDAQDARGRRVAGDGTFLSQEDARAFVTEDSRTRGARVLSGYSRLAQEAQAYATREYESANRQRQDWLRQFELSTNIKKSQTRWERLCKHLLNGEVPKASSQVVSWLDAVAEFNAKTDAYASQVRQVLISKDGDEGRGTLALTVAQLGEIGAYEEAQSSIADWLNSRNVAMHNIEWLISELKPRQDILVSEREALETDLRTWRDWLQARSAEPSAVVTNADAALDEKLKGLLVDLEKLKVLGEEHRLQLDHLNFLQGNLLPKWVASHPELCPTCNTNHADSGGIAALVKKLANSLASRVAKERVQYAEMHATIKEIEKSRSLGGQCPISESRRFQLADFLGFGADRFALVEDLLKADRQLELKLARLDVLLAPPTIAPLGDAFSVASRLWKKISEENAKGQALWRLPDNWAKVRDTLSHQSMLIVQKHLPQTLEAVWIELAMALTPARWNLIGAPRMEAETLQGAESLKVLAAGKNRSVAAKYFYNQAEQHTLGLAWFFARYFSYGRFRHGLIAMDDPAQEMDQTTFRAFARFIQTLLRLHANNNRQLTLLILLHQEERALDMARATHQKLTTIKWGQRIKSDGPNSSVEQLVLLSPEFKPRMPVALTERATVASK